MRRFPLPCSEWSAILKAELTANDLASLQRMWRDVQPYLAREMVPGELIAQPLAEYFAALVDAAPALFKLAERQIALEGSAQS